MGATPAVLAEAGWLPELQACCAVSAATSKAEDSGDARMGSVLQWLQTMLVNLELGSTMELDGVEDELDDGFVSAARPWLHTKAFFAIEAPDFSQALWQQISGAEYLQPGGAGGSLLLLLPSALPLTLFEQVAESVRRGVATDLNPAVVVSGYHPDTEAVDKQSPTPVLQLFLDSEDLLVDGGSMSDAAGFL